MKLYLLVAPLLLVLGSLANAAPISNKIVVQANGDKAQFERSLKLASNMHEILVKAKFEIVVFGPAVKFLTEESEEISLVQKIQGEGIIITACGRSLKTDNVKESDLASGITITPFGAVHIVNRQKQGWQYFKP